MAFAGAVIHSFVISRKRGKCEEAAENNEEEWHKTKHEAK